HVHVRGPSDVELEVVGVARDAQDHDLRDEPVRRLYVSYPQPIDGIVRAKCEVRAAGDMGALSAAVREETRRFDPKLQILNLKPAEVPIEHRIVSGGSGASRR